MARYVALLRGVNVGPTTKVPMPELRALIEQQGHDEVKTLLNSGNAVFTARGAPARFGPPLEREMAERFGFKIDLVLRSQKQIDAALARDPIEQADNDSRYFIAFLSEKPKAAAVKSVLETDFGQERCALYGSEFYVWSPDGVAKSKAVEAFTRAKAVDHMTVRNFATVKKIAAALAEPG